MFLCPSIMKYTFKQSPKILITANACFVRSYRFTQTTKHSNSLLILTAFWWIFSIQVTKSSFILALNTKMIFNAALLFDFYCKMGWYFQEKIIELYASACTQCRRGQKLRNHPFFWPWIFCSEINLSLSCQATDMLVSVTLHTVTYTNHIIHISAAWLNNIIEF